MKKKIWFAIACLLMVSTVRSQTIDGKVIVRTEMLTEATDFSRPFDVGIHFQMEPEWYVYWINPGDGGLPVEVQWQLPEGWKVHPLRYPTPQKFVHEEMVSYGYKNSVLLLATVIPPAGWSRDRIPPISAKLDWLVCKESCVRGKATVHLARNESDRPRIAELFRQTRARLPQPVEKSGLVIRSAELVDEGSAKRVRFSVGGTNAAAVSDFYPEALEHASIRLNSIRVDRGVVSLLVTPESVNTRCEEIRGLLVVGEKAYECRIPLKANP